MKRMLRLYLIITSILIVSNITAIISVNIARRDIKLDSSTFINNFEHTIYDNTIFNFDETFLEELNYNESITINEIIQFETTDAMKKIAIIGAIENSTGINQGFIEIQTIDQDTNTPSIQTEIEFQDTTITNETSYIKGIYHTKSLDGEKNQLLFALLKEIDSENIVEFLAYENDILKVNSTFIAPKNRLETIFDFKLLDINKDNISELFLIGTNKTASELVICEFYYNLTSQTFDFTQAFSMNYIDNLFIDMNLVEKENSVYFYITEVKTGSDIETSTTVLSLGKEIASSFALTSNNTYNFGFDNFRAYNAKLVRSDGFVDPRLALFGTYIDNGISNYAYCLLVSYTNGIQTNLDGIRLNQTPDWSVDGLIIDLNFDGEDEIIQTTYDLLSASTSSKYTIVSSSELMEIDNGLLDISRVRASTKITLEKCQIGLFLAKDSSSNDVISYHLLQHEPFKLIGTSKILTENSPCNFTIENYDYNGNIQTRNDLRFNISLLSDQDSFVTATELPENMTIATEPIDNSTIEDDLVISLQKNSIIILNDSITIDIGKKPFFTAVLPGSPIILRNKNSKTEIIETTIVNNLNVDLEVELSIWTQDYDTTNLISINSYTSESYEFQFLFYYNTLKKSSSEQISITMTSELGTYLLRSEIEIISGFAISSSDLVLILIVISIITIIGYIIFTRVIYNHTKMILHKRYSEDKTDKIEFELFRKNALKSLKEQYSQKGNWKAGIKLAQDFDPKAIAYFHKMKAKDQLRLGQLALTKGELKNGLHYWNEAKESLLIIGNNQFIDTLNWLLNPLEKIVEALAIKKGAEKVKILQTEFETLSGLKSQTKIILNTKLDIPLYLIAEKLGVALRDIDELQSSLNYLQIAYQDAPNEIKHRIVDEITSLIGMGVTPAEISLPKNLDTIRKRIEQKIIRCFSCGEERANIDDVCPNCEIETVKCSVCKLPISYGTKHLECPYCQGIAHREHLQEWVKVKGTCPICQERISADKLSST